MNDWIQGMIWTHAGLGAIALLSGLLAISSRKGGVIHRKAGMVFFSSMLLSGGTAMVISWLPDHENLFLFFIGIFSCYFTITGFRAIRYRRKDLKLGVDYAISITMLLTGIMMLVYPLICCGSINIVLAVFGMVGLYFSIRDLFNYRNPERLKEVWQQLHLGKMMGGYISAMTAFTVVNQFLPGIYNWFTPGLLGTLYIFWWLRRLNNPNDRQPSNTSHS